MKASVAALPDFFLGIHIPFTASRMIHPARLQRLRAISAVSTVAATAAGSYLYPEGEKL